MKIRAVTTTVSLNRQDFLSKEALIRKLLACKAALDELSSSLRTSGYEVQTMRISLNPMEEWLTLDGEQPNREIALLIDIVNELGIEFLSLGNCSTIRYLQHVPSILAMSSRVFCSFLFRKDEHQIAPNPIAAREVARVAMEISRTSGVMGNFRFCAAFNCSGSIPFFPASYSEADSNADSGGIKLSVALENGDCLFISFHGADSFGEGSANLQETMRQALLPIQDIVQSACSRLVIEYAGIDASINPGLSLPDSVGAGLEHLLTATLSNPENPPHLLQPLAFGSYGSLAAVAAITTAIKSLSAPDAQGGRAIKLTGYSGLMLPVMEDLILSQRAAQTPPAFTIRELLTYSAVCGVGLDTIPIPGNASEEAIAGIFIETGALAFRLNKPLSCRFLPMPGKGAGDITDIDSPYICNTRVFHI